MSAGKDEAQGVTSRLFGRYPKSTLERFKRFHAENPEVYEEFRRMAFAIKETGRTKYSAETIINAIRWHVDLKTKGDIFKINDHYRSIYARLLVYHHPEFDGFFEFRSPASDSLAS